MSDSFMFMDKYRINVHTHLPQLEDGAQDKQVTFVFMNGLGVPQQKYQQFFDGLAKKGYTIISADYPCCGENQPKLNRRVNYGYDELLEYFIPPLIDIAKGISDDNSVYLMGHSLGGQLSTFYSAIHGVPMIGVASGNVYHKNWEGTGQLHILKIMVVFQTLIRLYGYLPAHLLKLGDRESKGLIHNWCHMALTGRYDFIKRGLNTSKGKGMYVCIQGDEFAPLKATKHLAKLCSNATDATLIPIRLPEHLKGNPHGVWIKDPARVIETIDAYMTTDNMTSNQ